MSRMESMSTAGRIDPAMVGLLHTHVDRCYTLAVGAC
jgi:hypothetical protein